jgi:hypothetical protein
MSALISGAHAHTWTSSDGAKTFEGDLLSYDPETGKVDVSLTGGKVMSFHRDKLSAADRSFLEAKGKTTAVSVKPPSTDVADAGQEVIFKRHDGQAADMAKPVKVFILLGQSNMVGLGKIKGGEGSLENGRTLDPKSKPKPAPPMVVK